MKKCLLLVFVFLTLGVCANGQSASVTFAKEIDFGQYKTYKWVNIDGALRLDDLTAEQLVASLDMQLSKKGLAKAPPDGGDLLIGYRVTAEGDKHFNQSSVGGSYGSAVGSGSATGKVDVMTVHSGQLVLDMYDAGKKQLVWRGIVTDAFDPEAKPEKKQKHLEKALEKLLKDYPPQKK